jgi:hypothetical protein
MPVAAQVTGAIGGRELGTRQSGANGQPAVFVVPGHRGETVHAKASDGLGRQGEASVRL